MPIAMQLQEKSHFSEVMILSSNQDYTNKLQNGSSSLFHLRTIWLFTRSDLKTIVFPQTIFGLVVALSGPPLTTNTQTEPFELLENMPKVTVWIWLNLLNEAISNQRLPDSIIEDSINKPWRPMPSKRLTTKGARQLNLLTIPVIMAMSLLFRSYEAAVALIILSHMYNELHGANENWIVRNLLNACGFSSFSIGAATIACGHGKNAITNETYTWIGILAAVIATTIQMQDLPDIEGDRKRGRKTVPLLYGHGLTRWSVAVLVFCWSIACPFYWTSNVVVFAPSVAIGGVIAARVLQMRRCDADEGTWKLWCVWMMVLYMIPLMKRISETAANA